MVGFNAIQLHAVQSISVHSSRELTSVTRSTCIRMWKAAKKRANAPFYSPFPSHTSRLETSQLEDADGRLKKKPGLWNSLRFGKEGCNIELWFNLISKFKQKLTNFSFGVIFFVNLVKLVSGSLGLVWVLPQNFFSLGFNLGMFFTSLSLGRFSAYFRIFIR